VVLGAAKLAELRDLPLEQIAEMTTKHARSLGWMAPWQQDKRIKLGNGRCTRS
jgi:hypothetical protein